MDIRFCSKRIANPKNEFVVNLVQAKFLANCGAASSEKVEH